MIIAYDAKRLFFNSSGLGNYGRGLIRSLCATYPQHEYWLYTPVSPALSYLPPTSARIRFPDRMSGRLSQAWWRLRGLSFQVGRDKPDIYHGLNNELPLGIGSIGCRTVMTVHDLILKRYPGYFSRIDRMVYEWKGRTSATVADLIVADSEQTKRDLVEFYKVPPARIRVVYPGVDPLFAIPATPDRIAAVRSKYGLAGPYILCVGTIEPRKNQALIVAGSAMAKLDMTVVLVGRSTPYADEVRQTARRYGCQGSLRILSSVSTEDLPLLYAGAGVFAYPSRFEGFGIPLLESLCCKTPVIAATGSCLEESGGPGSVYVDPDSPEQMADALTRVLGDSGLRARMIEQGAEHSRKFTDENIARAQMAVYAELMA